MHGKKLIEKQCPLVKQEPTVVQDKTWPHISQATKMKVLTWAMKFCHVHPTYWTASFWPFGTFSSKKQHIPKLKRSNWRISAIYAEKQMVSFVKVKCLISSWRKTVNAPDPYVDWIKLIF